MVAGVSIMKDARAISNSINNDFVVTFFYRKSGSTFGSGNVDWSNWGDDWAEPGAEAGEQQASRSSNSKKKASAGSWSDWNDEQLSPVVDKEERNHSSSKSSSKKDSSQSHSNGVRSSKKQTVAAEEPNLIDFDTFGEKSGSKPSAPARAPSNDGWDADVWADEDDDNWETIETSAAQKSSAKNKTK